MEVPQKKAKTCPNGTNDARAPAPTAAQQIAALQAELERCELEKTAAIAEKIAAEQRHDRVVREMKSALEWAYSGKFIPRRHWLEKGHNEEYAYLMEALLNSFEQIIKELMTGTVGATIKVEFDLQVDAGHVTADHDDVLMPYWKELANSLVHWSEYHAGEETLEVSILCIETPDAVLDVLRPAIMQSNANSLGFTGDGTPKTWKLAEFIEDIVQTNHTVATVGFDSVILSNAEWKTICNAIRKRNAQSSIMDYFQLTECFVGGISPDMLDDILTSKAAAIDLEMNEMSSRESLIIAEHLASNPPLDLLTLKGNRFDDTDAAFLANSLSSNTTLLGLHVDGNDIKEEGRISFLRAIWDVTSLASCIASNHTCQIFGLEQDISDLNCHPEASYNKWTKIFAMLVLSREDSFVNTALLSGVPASLMPVLLYRANDQEEGSPQITDSYLELTGAKRCRKHDVWDNLEHTRRLSCMYDLIRSWVVPAIYV